MGREESRVGNITVLLKLYCDTCEICSLYIKNKKENVYFGDYVWISVFLPQNKLLIPSNPKENVHISFP